MKVIVLLASILLVAVACSSDEAPATEAPATEASATEAPATEAPATEAPATEAPATEAPATEAPATETTAGLPAQCVQGSYEVGLRRSGDGENETLTIVDAEDDGNAVRDGGAMAYKIFATDFEIADDEDLVSQIILADLPADATLVTLDISRTFDADDDTLSNEYPLIAAGDELIAFRDAVGPASAPGMQVTIATSDGVTTTNTVNATASGEVLYADDSWVCADVTIESEAGFQLSGVVTARVRG
jgi:hypothetical protein